MAKLINYMKNIRFLWLVVLLLCSSVQVLPQETNFEDEIPILISNNK